MPRLYKRYWVITVSLVAKIRTALVSKAFIYMGSREVKAPLLQKVARYVNKMIGVLGLVDVDSFKMTQTSSSSDSSVLYPLLDALVEFRKQVFWNHDFF